MRLATALPVLALTALVAMASPDTEQREGSRGVGPGEPRRRLLEQQGSGRWWTGLADAIKSQAKVLTSREQPEAQPAGDDEDHETNMMEERFEDLAALLEQEKDMPAEASSDTTGIELIGDAIDALGALPATRRDEDGPGEGEGDEGEGIEDAEEDEGEGEEGEETTPEAAAASHDPPQALPIRDNLSAQQLPQAPPPPPDNSGSLIRMMSCGGAPADIVPFRREASPWGLEKAFVGVLPKSGKGGKDRRRALLGSEPRSRGMPGTEEFGGMLEEADWQQGQASVESAGADVNETSHDFWEFDALRTAISHDLREDPLGDSWDDRAYVGPRALRLLRSWATSSSSRPSDTIDIREDRAAAEWGPGESDLELGYQDAPRQPADGNVQCTEEDERWRRQNTTRASRELLATVGKSRGFVGVERRRQKASLSKPAQKPSKSPPARRGGAGSSHSSNPLRSRSSGRKSGSSGRSQRGPSEMRKTGCKGTLRKVTYENEGFGKKTTKSSRSGDSLVKGCLSSSELCTASAFKAGSGLPSIKLLRKVPKASLGSKRYRSCALVGNAGHLIKHKYGHYIDRHEAVVRFNVLRVKKFSSHVGSRTTFRVLNNARSADACCHGMLPEGKGSPIGLIMWYPAGKQEMKKKCKSKYPMHKIYQLSPKFIDREVKAINALRLELQKLGLGGKLGSWKQLTSGGHAVLLFSKVCDSISLYGFTTWSKKGPDQYGGRGHKTNSGQHWHDWDGESLSWRLLFVAGQLQICSK